MGRWLHAVLKERVGTPLTGNSTGERRIVRGGGMGYNWEYCNSYDRQTDNLPYSRWENCGVRIVRNAD